MADNKEIIASFNQMRKQAADNQANLGGSTIIEVDEQVEKTLKKHAAAVGSSMITRMAPAIWSPVLQLTSMVLPKTIEEKNIWRRWYYQHDPVIGTAIDLHIRHPLSTFRLRCDGDEYSEVSSEYELLAQETDLFETFMWIGQEYWVSGESFVTGDWNEERRCWNGHFLLNPDIVDVQVNPFNQKEKYISMIKWSKPIRTIIENGPRDPKTGPIYNSLMEHDADLVEAVKTNRPFRISPNIVSHVARKVSPFDLRGTSIIDRLFKVLLYQEKLVEAQMAGASRYATPIELWKLGSDNEPASQQGLDLLEQCIQQTWNSPNKALIWGHTLCLTPEAKIITPDYSYIEAKDIKIGDDVITHTGKQTKIKNVWEYAAPETIYEIKPWGICDPIKATAEHKFPVVKRETIKCGKSLTDRHPEDNIKGKLCGIACSEVKERTYQPCRSCIKNTGYPTPNIEFVEAKNLQQGDYLVVPKNIERTETINELTIEPGAVGNYVCNPIPDSLPLTEDLAYFIGFYLAEGHTVDDSLRGYPTCIGTHINLDESSRVVLRRVLGRLNINYSEKPDGNGIRFMFNHARLGRTLIRLCGKGAATKQLAPEIMNWEPKYQEALIAGWLDGDGYSHNREFTDTYGYTYESNNITGVTTSPQLAWQIWRLLVNLGYTPDIHKQDNRGKKSNINGRDFETKHIAYNIRLYNSDAAKLGSYLLRNRTNIECSKKFSKKLIWGDYLLIPIRLINEISNNEPVYCFEVEDEEHTYIVNGVGSHNSAEMIGGSGQLLPTTSEMEWITTQKCAALMVNQSIINADGPTYASASVAADFMASFYLNYRMELEKWAKNYYFKPIAKARGYYKPVQREVAAHYRDKTVQRELMIPEIMWDKANLKDDYQKLQQLISLAEGNKVPWRIVYDYMNLDFDTVMKQLEEEGKIFAKLAPAGGMPGGEGVPGAGVADFMAGGMPGGSPAEGELGGTEMPAMPSTGPASPGGLTMPPESVGMPSMEGAGNGV